MFVIGSDWSDWRTNGADFQAVCLYCDHRSAATDSALQHLKVGVVFYMYYATVVPIDCSNRYV